MKYERAQSLSHALAFLDAHGPNTEILAGGTDVMVDLRSGDLKKRYLLDISRIDALKSIEICDDELHVGSGVTLTEIHRSPLIAAHAPALQKCADTFAARQILNVATIGGNVAHASPCGDTIPPLVIHDAVAVIATLQGEKKIPMDDIAAGAYQSALAPGDIIVKFILKSGKGRFADFQKIGRRKALAVSRISMAIQAEKDDAGRISFIRVSLGACTPTPHRMDAVESHLSDGVLTEKRVWQAADLLAEKMIDITGRRASIVYKEPAVKGLFVRMTYPLVTWGKTDD